MLLTGADGQPALGMAVLGLRGWAAVGPAGGPDPGPSADTGCVALVGGSATAYIPHAYTFTSNFTNLPPLIDTNTGRITGATPAVSPLARGVSSAVRFLERRARA